MTREHDRHIQIRCKKLPQEHLPLIRRAARAQRRKSRAEKRECAESVVRLPHREERLQKALTTLHEIRTCTAFLQEREQGANALNGALQVWLRRQYRQ